jgi:hypothetical protein
MLALNEDEATKLGISARTLYNWKAKIRDGKKVTLNDTVKVKIA